MLLPSYCCEIRYLLAGNILYVVIRDWQWTDDAIINNENVAEMLTTRRHFHYKHDLLTVQSQLVALSVLLPQEQRSPAGGGVGTPVMRVLHGYIRLSPSPGLESGLTCQ